MRTFHRIELLAASTPALIKNNCVTQYLKFTNKNIRTARDTICEEGEIATVDNIEKSITIAPGGRKKPISILNVYCEEMAHPHLFPTGKFG